MRFLIDTNVYIQALAGKAPDTTFLKRAVLNKTVVFSPVVIAEFLARALKEEQEIFEEMMQSFPILSIDEETARTAATYRKESLQTSKARLLDCFLAAQAKLHQCVLVTNNRSDFPMGDIQIIAPS